MGSLQALLQAGQTLPDRLESLAARLEKGQAAAPLSEAAATLRDFVPSSYELTLLLIGMTLEARAFILNWLIGPQYQNISVKLSEPLDQLEIRLQERGFSLESDLTGWREFASPEDFLVALNQRAESQAIDSELIESIRLGLDAPPSLRNLTILAPGQPRMAAASVILSNLSTRNAVLLLAAPTSYSWSDDDRMSLTLAAANSPAVWPVLIGEPGGDEVELLNLLRNLSTPLLPVMRLEYPNPADIPDFIVDGPQHPLRQAIALAAHQRGCMSLIDMIDERYASDLRQIESRQKREARLERAADAGTEEQDVKAIFDRCKDQFNSELARVLQALRENGRSSLLKSGNFGQMLDTLLTSLKADDLEREIAHRTIRLSLKPTVLADFRRRLGKVLRQQIDEDCILIRDTLELIRQSAEPMLAEAGAITRSMTLMAPDHRALWDSLAESLQLEIKYRGELPRRRFWQRLAEGRRTVLVANMLLSLLGGYLGFTVHQIGLFGIIFFLVLFLAGVIYTYTNWNKEELENLDKEIDKIRANLRTELSRLLNELVAEKHSRYQKILDDLKKAGLGRLDQALLEVQNAKLQGMEAQRREARDKLRLIDLRLKELQPLGVELRELRHALTRFGEEGRAFIVELTKTEATL